MESEQRVSKQEALDLILAHWEPERTVETVPLAEAAGRALARDLTARYDLPVVRASAMDGVAISYASVKEGIPDTTAWRKGRDYVRADIVLLNAGTSKGGEDCCGQLMEDSGGSLFHGVAAVPGRPMGAAIIQGKPVLNLSGPALACFYSLDWMVRPLVCHMLGISLPRREAVVAELTAPLRTPPMFSMLTQMRVERRADGTYTATPLAFRGPGAVSTARALTANGMYVSAPGELPHGEGTLIQVELLRQDG